MVDQQHEGQQLPEMSPRQRESALERSHRADVLARDNRDQRAAAGRATTRKDEQGRSGSQPAARRQVGRRSWSSPPAGRASRVIARTSRQDQDQRHRSPSARRESGSADAAAPARSPRRRCPPAVGQQHDRHLAGQHDDDHDQRDQHPRARLPAARRRTVRGSTIALTTAGTRIRPSATGAISRRFAAMRSLGFVPCLADR